MQRTYESHIIIKSIKEKYRESFEVCTLKKGTCVPKVIVKQVLRIFRPVNIFVGLR